MPSHFQSYISNFNRVRLSELIDYHALQARIENARPPLVVNPLTTAHYDDDARAADKHLAKS